MKTLKALPLILLVFTSIPVDAEVLLKTGSIYTLKPYPSTDSIYIKIEAQSEHPLLESIYAITYHGICIHHENAFNKEKRTLGPSFIAKEALINSIDLNRKPHTSKKIICTDNMWGKYSDFLNAIIAGHDSVEIDPLNNMLSSYEESGNFKLVW
jgi:hypothetical protein